MKIVAILPTHSRKKMVVDAIRSVESQTLKPNIFFVLDNGSSDGTTAALNELMVEYKNNSKLNLKILRSDTNLGASGGMRYLIEAALSEAPDWIWFMDDDAIADSTALEHQVNSTVINDEDTYILTSKILNKDGIWTSENHPALFNESTFEFNGINIEKVLHEPIIVNTGGYCGWFVRAKCFQEFGFPRADLYFWFDDIEYVVRVSRKKNVYLIPDSVIKHFAQSLVEHEVKWPFSGALPKIPEKHLPRYFYWYRNYLWFAKQWLPKNKFYIFLLKHLVRGLMSPVLFRQSKTLKRWKIVFSACLDGASEKLGKKEGML